MDFVDVKTGKRIPPRRIHVPSWYELHEDVVEEFKTAKSLTDLSPKAIFYDFASFPDESVELVKQHCLSKGYSAFFERGPAWRGGWLLIRMAGIWDGVNYARSDAWLRFFRNPTLDTSLLREGGRPLVPVVVERRIEEALALRLRERGVNPRRQVRCCAGIADIVTDDAVYEVKRSLDASTFFQAIGQVLLYRAAIDSSKRAVVVGPKHVDVARLRGAAQARRRRNLDLGRGGHRWHALARRDSRIPGSIRTSPLR